MLFVAVETPKEALYTSSGLISLAPILRHLASEEMLRFGKSFALALSLLISQAEAFHICVDDLARAAQTAISKEKGESPTGIYRLDFFREGNKAISDGPKAREELIAFFITQVMKPADAPQEKLSEIGLSITGHDFASARQAILDYLDRIEREAATGLQSLHSVWSLHSDSPYKIIRWLPIGGVTAGLGFLAGIAAGVPPKYIASATLVVLATTFCSVGVACAKNMRSWKSDINENQKKYLDFRAEVAKLLDPGEIAPPHSFRDLRLIQKSSVSEKTRTTQLTFRLEINNEGIPELQIRSLNSNENDKPEPARR